MTNISIPTPKILYLSHTDFCKCRLYFVEASLHGTFEERIKQFNNDIQAHIDIYGYCPSEVYEEKALYVREWVNAWRNSRYIRVDIDTGEIDEP